MTALLQKISQNARKRTLIPIITAHMLSTFRKANEAKSTRLNPVFRVYLKQISFLREK
jgi:hypothetical protein